VCGAEGRWKGTWSWGWEAGVGGPAAGGQWSARWGAKPDGDTVIQTWSAAWVGPPLEASVRWTVEGLSLGWFGPRSSVSALLRWLF
jgi:hypothetical protein